MGHQGSLLSSWLIATTLTDIGSSHSPSLLFVRLGCRYDPWNTADVWQWEDKQEHKNPLSEGVSAEMEKDPWSLTASLNSLIYHPRAALDLLLHKRNLIYLSYHLLGFLLTAACVLGWVIWNSLLKNCWRSKFHMAQSILWMDVDRIQDHFTSSVVKISPFLLSCRLNVYLFVTISGI